MEENLSMVYAEPGVRGEKRQSLTNNQKAILWSRYQNEPVKLRLSQRKLGNIEKALKAKGMLDEGGVITARGISYVTRIRKF